MPDLNSITITLPLLIRLFSRVRFSTTRFYKGTPCWNPTTYQMPNGYHRFSINQQYYYAHRVMYAFFVEPLIPFQEIDHLCRHRGCCNPCHLEQVTKLENILRSDSITAKQKRQTHCKRGHDLSLATIYNGGRRCDECRRQRSREAYRRDTPEQYARRLECNRINQQRYREQRRAPQCQASSAHSM